MNLTVILNSKKQSSTSQDRVVIGNDLVPNTETKLEWFYNALNYASIIKSDLELENRQVFNKIKLVGEDFTVDNINFPLTKIYPNCLFSTDIEYYLHHLDRPEERCRRHPIRIASPYKWVGDSITFDKISSIKYRVLVGLQNKNRTYFQVDTATGSPTYTYIEPTLYGFFRMLNNLNIYCYEY